MSNINFCTYMTPNGLIMSTGSCDPDLLNQQPVPPGCAIIAVEQPVFPIGWYMDVSQTPPVPTVRPAFPGAIDKTAIAANGTDAATLSGLPNPSAVTVIGPGVHSRTVVTDGIFAFTSSAAGLFKIYVDAFPAKQFQTAVTAS